MTGWRGEFWGISLDRRLSPVRHRDFSSQAGLLPMHWKESALRRQGEEEINVPQTGGQLPPGPIG